MFCENNTSLSWESVTSDLADSVESNTQYKGISIDELCKVAQSLQRNICIYLKELDFDFNNQKLCTVVKLMSVFLLSNKDTTILINLHKLVYTPGVFEAIFLKYDSCNVQEMKENKEDLPTSIDESEKKVQEFNWGNCQLFRSSRKL